MQVPLEHSWNHQDGVVVQILQQILETKVGVQVITQPTPYPFLTISQACCSCCAHRLEELRSGSNLSYGNVVAGLVLASSQHIRLSCCVRRHLLRLGHTSHYRCSSVTLSLLLGHTTAASIPYTQVIR